MQTRWPLIVTCLLFAISPAGGAEETEVEALVLELAGQTPAAPRAPEALEQAYTQVLDHLMPLMSADDVALREPALKSFEQVCLRAARPGAEVERAALATATLRRLTPATPAAARVWMVRQLQWIGAGEAVAALTLLLTDADAETRDAARRALELNPDRGATTALVDAFRRAQDSTTRIGLLNALAARRAAECEALFVAAAGDGDFAVARVGIAALADLGGDSALATLEALSRSDSQPTARAAQEARLRAAESLIARDAPRAKQIFESLLTHSDPAVSVAALRGVCSVEGAAAIDRLLTVMASAGEGLPRHTAAALAAELPGADVTARLTQALPSAEPLVQCALLAALATRGDRAAALAVADLLRSGSGDVRSAAIEALQTVGDERVVAALAVCAASDGEAERDGARMALQRLRGDEVDRALIGIVQLSSDSGARGEALRALAERRCTAAEPLYEACLRDSDTAIRRGAYAAIGKVGAYRRVTDLIQAIDMETDEACREAAEDALATVTLRETDGAARVAPLVEALSTSHVKTQASLLRVLSRAQSPAALGAVRGKLTDATPEVREAAVRALCRWEDAAAMDDLLLLTRAGQGAELSLALRSVIRLARGDRQRAAPERLAILREAFERAPGDEERKQALAALATLRSREALSAALTSVSSAALRDEAALAAIAIARNLAVESPSDSAAAFEQVRAAGVGENVLKKIDEFQKVAADYGGGLGTWAWAGPYLEEGKKARELCDIVFPPEPATPPASSPAPAPATTIDWRPLTAHVDGNPWLFDCTQIDPAGQRCGYARSVLHVEDEQPATLELGADDAVKVWLNGELIHSNLAFRSVKRADDKVKIQLRKGANTLLLKIVQSDGGWGFTAAIKDQEGAAIPTLRQTRD